MKATWAGGPGGFSLDAKASGSTHPRRASVRISQGSGWGVKSPPFSLAGFRGQLPVDRRGSYFSIQLWAPRTLPATA